MDRLYTNAAWLRQKYVVEELPATEIADLAGCHFSTIYYWLRKNGIEVRTLSKAKEIHYKDPETREQRSRTQTQLWRNPEYRRNQMEIRQGKEFRQRQSEIVSEVWKDDEYRKQQAETSKALWQDEAYREKTLPALLARWDDPEYVEAHEKRTKELWRDPEYRQMMAEGAREHFKELWQDPEWREKKRKHVASYMSEITSARWENGDFDNLFLSPTRPEQRLMKAMDAQGIDYQFQYRPDGYTRIYDFYIPQGNLLLEYDGWFWHESEWAKEHGLAQRDKEKTAFAHDNGFRFIRIQEYVLKTLGADCIIDKVNSLYLG